MSHEHVEDIEKLDLSYVEHEDSRNLTPIRSYGSTSELDESVYPRSDGIIKNFFKNPNCKNHSEIPLQISFLEKNPYNL
jgi:hypothetical protein